MKLDGNKAEFQVIEAVRGSNIKLNTHEGCHLGMAGSTMEAPTFHPKAIRFA